MKVRNNCAETRNGCILIIREPKTALLRRRPIRPFISKTSDHQHHETRFAVSVYRYAARSFVGSSPSPRSSVVAVADVVECWPTGATTRHSITGSHPARPRPTWWCSASFWIQGHRGQYEERATGGVSPWHGVHSSRSFQPGQTDCGCRRLGSTSWHCRLWKSPLGTCTSFLPFLLYWDLGGLWVLLDWDCLCRDAGKVLSSGLG